MRHINRGADNPWDVQVEVAKIAGGAPEVGSESPIPFFHMLERLKTTKREGWRRFGITQLVSPQIIYETANVP